MAPRIANLSEWCAHILERPALTDVAVPLRVRQGDRELSFFSMTAVVGAPRDITVSEVAIESFYPADAQTADPLDAIRRSLI